MNECQLANELANWTQAQIFESSRTIDFYLACFLFKNFLHWIFCLLHEYSKHKSYCQSGLDLKGNFEFQMHVSNHYLHLSLDLSTIMTFKHCFLYCSSSILFIDKHLMRPVCQYDKFLNSHLSLQNCNSLAKCCEALSPYDCFYKSLSYQLAASYQSFF